MKQQQEREAEEGRRVREQLAEAEREARVKAAVENSNRRSVAPAKVFEPHTVHTESGPFVWATLTDCWKCGQQMMVREASSPRTAESYTSAPALTVKTTDGQKRYENHPDVHRAIEAWMTQSSGTVTKARIELRNSQFKGETYSAFVCPKCSALMGQHFIAQIKPEHWSIISAPLLRRT